jgi:hypothetical protein
VVEKYVDVETAKQTGRSGFAEMVNYFKKQHKTTTQKESRFSEKFIHGIKVLMAKSYIDNLSEERRKGMLDVDGVRS